MSLTTNRARSELIIGITLAETFLLLLFVVWYGFSPEQGNSEIARLKDEVARLNKQIDGLKVQLKADQIRIDDLAEDRRILLIILGLDPKTFDPKAAGARKAIEDACKRLGQGLPKCELENVLIEASVVHGQTSMKVLLTSASLSAFMTSLGHHYPAVGVSITDPSIIQQFLDDVARYHPSSGVEGGECRFDYRLRWATSDDYLYGRERFERFFYPARNMRVPAQ